MVIGGAMGGNGMGYAFIAGLLGAVTFVLLTRWFG